MISNRKFKKLLRDPKLFFSDMLMKHHKKISFLNRKKKYDGNNQFTIVSAVYGVDKYLDDYFESLVKQRLDFQKHIHLIMVDDGSKDNSAAIIKKWQKKYPKNITYIKKENGGQASARNLGIKYVKTKWVTFIDPDDFISLEYFLEIDEFLKKQSNEYALLGCNFIFYFEKNGQYKDTHPLKYKFQKDNNIVSCLDLKDNIQMAVNSTIFLTEIIQKNKINYDDRVKPNFEDAHFVAFYLNYASEYDAAFLRKPKYFYRKRADESSTLDNSWKDKRIFLDKILYGHLSIFSFYMKKNGYIPRHIQRMVLYDISWTLKRITRDSKTALSCLTENEITEFFSLLKKSISFIDSRTIVTFNLAGYWWLDKVILLGAFKDGKLPEQFSYVDKINARNDLVFSVIDHDFDKVEFMSDGRIITPVRIKRFDYQVEGKYLANRTYYWIPLAEITQNIGIYINGELTSITIKGKRYKRLISNNELIKDLLCKTEKSGWVFMDRDVQADDNAEHLYRYVQNTHPEQKIAFVLNKTSHDWNRLELDGFNLLEYGSIEHKQALLNSNRLISSHADGYVLDCFKELNTKKSFVFLQHGIIQNDHSEWLNTKKKLDLFITSTEAEYNSIISDDSQYLFSDREVVLTGLPRHDDLWKKSLSTSVEKIILIMPTWRASIVGPTIDGSVREINDDFIYSDYYKYWSSVLSSNILSNISKRYGYKVIFAPHKYIEQYLSCFQIPDYISVWRSGEDESMQDLFVKSQLLVTDYSSVAFEMAYLNKPVLYYQFDEESFFSNHTLKTGYYRYDHHGFGPKVNCEDELFFELESFCKNNCINRPKYLDRIKQTFSYQDSNNSKRVFDEIKKLDDIYYNSINYDDSNIRDLDSNIDIKHYRRIHTYIASKIQKLKSSRFSGSDKYYDFLKYSCDVGRLDILNSIVQADQKSLLLQEYILDNKEIKRIVSFSLNIEIQKLYFACTKEGFLENKVEFFKKELMLDIDSNTSGDFGAFENMLTSYKLYLFLKEAPINFITAKEALKIFNYLRALKQCSELRRSICLLSLLEYCMASDLPEFFKLKSKFYNHVNSIFSLLIYSKYIDEGIKKSLTSDYLNIIRRYNDFSMLSKPKIAVCISGKYRNHSESIKSIVNNIVTPLGADVFVHTWDNMDVWSGIGSAPFITRSLGPDVTRTLPYGIYQIPQLAKYFPLTCGILKKPISQKIEKNNDLTLLNPISIQIDSESSFEESLGENDYSISRGSLNQIKMFYGMQQVFNSALKDQEYDYIIRCRPDWVISKPISDDLIKSLENNTFYSYIDSGYAFSDALFIISSSMAYNFSQTVGDMFEQKKLSPFVHFPEYDAHNLMMSWVLKNNYSYSSEVVEGDILNNQEVNVPGLSYALNADYENLKSDDKVKFLEFIKIMINKYGDEK